MSCLGGVFAKNTSFETIGFEDSQMSLAAKAARDICLSSQPLFFANNQNEINHGFAKKNNANEFEIYTFQRFQT
jgi:hypothetical protein